ncbi:MAG TPA: TetR/AcrR family transcriptional regulator [Armatimonadaceae bacterium]|nr:TetR/AcrR family transcriptional regulator [Armatimonadaceae bacterium]
MEHREQQGSAERQQDRADLRREQILEATRAVLDQVGFEKVTTRRIAETAGVNIATLHYYFGNKESLLSEAVRYAVNTAESRLRAAIADAPSAQEALRRAFAQVGDLVRERPGILRYDLIVRGFREPSATEEAKAIYATYLGLAQEILESHISAGGKLAPGMTVKSLAHYIVTALDGAILHHTLTGDDAAAEQTMELILEHALALMNAGSAEGAG